MQPLPKIHLGHGSNGYFRRLRQMDPAGSRQTMFFRDRFLNAVEPTQHELLALGKQLACAQPELASNSS